MPVVRLVGVDLTDLNVCGSHARKGNTHRGLVANMDRRFLQAPWERQRKKEEDAKLATGAECQLVRSVLVQERLIKAIVLTTVEGMRCECDDAWPPW